VTTPLDLFENELQSVEFSAEPLLQADRERASIASTKCLQALTPIPPNRRVFRDALREEQPFDAVDVLDPFGDQRPALTANLPAILLLGRGRHYHGADPWLAALVGQQGSDQSLAVDPIRLGPPPTARGGYGSWIHDVALDAGILKHAINPKPVQASLMDHDQTIRLPCTRLTLCL
jgi:hypothetical protein